jgi:CrcB protein
VGRFVFICFGGALGTGARYLVSTWVAQAYGPDFPRGTILINAAGSFLIAAIMELSLTTGAIPPTVRLFLTTGIMGGFTTYSSFNYETIRFLEQGAWGPGALNLALTVVLCLVAGSIGLVAARALVRLQSVLAR